MGAPSSTSVRLATAWSDADVPPRSLTLYATALGSAFLFAHMFFHGLHVLGCDAHALQQLSSIPLFAGVEAALLVGGLVGLPSAALLANRPGILRLLARVLRSAIVLFTLEILLFP